MKMHGSWLGKKLNLRFVRHSAVLKEASPNLLPYAVGTKMARFIGRERLEDSDVAQFDSALHYFTRLQRVSSGVDPGFRIQMTDEHAGICLL